MRIKLQSFPPLPVCRAWFSVHSATTVEELKSVLCKELPALRDGDLEPRDIDLVLDDFELLDISPVDVVRDGDLILIKQRLLITRGKRKAVDVGRPVRKRVKRSDDTKQSAPAKKTSAQEVKQRKGAERAALLHATKPDPLSSSSDSSSDSASSSSSESSDSDTESSSSESSSEGESSSSDSDTSQSSSDSAPSIAPTRPNGKLIGGPPRAKPTQGKAPAATENFVPPGLGKPATQSRNVRRRRKRMFERLEATTEPASVNEIPLGTRAETVAPVPSPAPVAAPSVHDMRASAAQDGRPPVFMMSTLQNKNKKKGFKKMMNSNIAAKIVFSSAAEEAAVEQTLQEAIPFTNTGDREVLATFSRLVPPSEKQEKGLLPPNMFVTSVDVEADLPRKRKKRKQQQVVDYEEEAAEVFELPYDDPMEAEPAVDSGLPSNDMTTSEAAPTTINRHEVESNWSSLPKITEASQVKSGVFVGWKELGINPQSFTPEMLLNVGRVVSCEQQLVVERHSDHAAEVSFGGLIMAEEGQNVELGYEWTDVFQGDWRFIQARTTSIAAT
ncbi:uncharacterized protein C8Q71DRAFT_8025 [Rhodofomes roseus]|uniref:Coilin n=1 Tax=Rhodofomes roseus TaxID=34475 RepID=A0ABQ8KYG1_9APHY|nr:uncharacterized protein C8Q71DRAFT_8025 [Rhodofomes roseus]KAH9843635.1 hypothetical protein C8Q71DRAFT_8025 [Rhodofomes roseus]